MKGAIPRAMNNPPKIARISEIPRAPSAFKPVKPYTAVGFTNASNTGSPPWQLPQLSLESLKYSLFISGFRIDLIQQVEEFCVFGNIRHAMTVMDESGDASFIHDHLGWHATQFKQVYFLPVKLKTLAWGSGNPMKGRSFFSQYA